jgi:hypothetical protein
MLMGIQTKIIAIHVDTQVGPAFLLFEASGIAFHQFHVRHETRDQETSNRFHRSFLIGAMWELRSNARRTTV